MNDSPLLLPEIVVKDHVCTLRREDPDVLRVVVPGVPVDMMDDFSGEEWTAQLPLGYRPVFVVGGLGTRVEPLLVAVYPKE